MLSPTTEPIPLEIELKLAFPPEARDRIEAHPALHGPGAGSAKAARQVSTYFDTADLALAREGLSLRVRSRDGRRTQTLKSADNGQGAAATRGEWEWAIRSDRPDTSLLAGTPAAHFAGAALAPTVVTDIHRTARRLVLDQGTIVEAALDQGTIQAGGREIPVHELELELKRGAPGPLYRLAQALHADLPLRLQPLAKAARGHALRDDHPPSPKKTPHPALSRDIGAADGFRRILGVAVGALIANQPAAASGDKEGVHQMRIAVRRLRTALALFRPHLEPAAASRFEDALRRLGQILGAARDWDVYTLDTLPAALKGGLRRQLQPAAEDHRVAALHRLRQEFDQPNLTGLILALSAWAEDDTLLANIANDARLAGIAPALLDRLAKKVVKRGRHIRRRSGGELHGVRKSLKKLRYAVADVAPLFRRKRVKSFRKHCLGIHDELGVINDAATAMTLSRTLADDRAAGRLPAVSATMRWSEKRRGKALKKLPEDWAAFREARRFWQ